MVILFKTKKNSPINSYNMNQNFVNQPFLPHLQQHKTRARYPLVNNNGYVFQPRGPNNTFIPMQHHQPQVLPPQFDPNFVNASMSRPPFPLGPQTPSSMYSFQTANIMPPITTPNGPIYTEANSQYMQASSMPLHPHMINASNFSAMQPQQPILNSGIMTKEEFYKYQERLRKEKA